MNCTGCKWWSELCAQQLGLGPMEAMCLNTESPQYQRMVSGGCARHQLGISIDDPGLQEEHER